MKITIAFFVLVIILTGCGTYQMQGAKDYPLDQLATLDTRVETDCIFVTLNEDCPTALNFFVKFVDGKSKGIGFIGYYDNFKLVPGDRVITVRSHHKSDLGTFIIYIDIAFEPKPGGSYKLAFHNVENRTWEATIIDVETGKRVDYEQTHPRCWESWSGALKCEHQREYLNENK